MLRFTEQENSLGVHKIHITGKEKRNSQNEQRVKEIDRTGKDLREVHRMGKELKRCTEQFPHSL